MFSFGELSMTFFAFSSLEWVRFMHSESLGGFEEVQELYISRELSIDEK